MRSLKMSEVKDGRPSKYKEEYCQIAEDFLAKGFSKLALAGELGICDKTIYNWMEKHPDFLHSIKKGEQKGLRFFEKILIAKLSGQEIAGFDSRKSDTACLLFTLKTRFYRIYGDKSKLELSVDDLEFSED